MEPIQNDKNYDVTIKLMTGDVMTFVVEGESLKKVLSQINSPSFPKTITIGNVTIVVQNIAMLVYTLAGENKEEKEEELTDASTQTEQDA